MIKIDDNRYFGEVLLRTSETEPLIKATLAKNIWVGGKQFVKTLTPTNINDHLYAYSGSPQFNVASVDGTIHFTTSLDVVYMNSGVSCRSISGNVQSIDTAYTAQTSKSKYVLVCNFTGGVNIAITLSKVSQGMYEVVFMLRISCGDNYSEWQVQGAANGSFSVSYNGSAYVASYTVKPVAGSKTYSVTSEECREQASRLELAGSVDAYTLGMYTGIADLRGVVTTGMARY